jgi:hypothetical protein
MNVSSEISTSEGSMLRSKKNGTYRPSLPFPTYAKSPSCTPRTTVCFIVAVHEREHFRDARAAPSERQAKEAYLLRRAPCSLDKAPPLGGVEIFPAVGSTEEALAVVGLLAHANLG